MARLLVQLKPTILGAREQDEHLLLFRLGVHDTSSFHKMGLVSTCAVTGPLLMTHSLFTLRLTALEFLPKQ